MRDDIIWIKDQSIKYAPEIPEIAKSASEISDKVTLWKKSFVIFSISLMVLSFLFVLTGFMLASYIRISHSPPGGSVIETLPSSSERGATPIPENANGYIVHFGSFSDKSTAESMKVAIEKKSSSSVSVVLKGDKYDVVSAPYKDYSTAEAISAGAKNDRIAATVIPA